MTFRRANRRLPPRPGGVRGEDRKDPGLEPSPEQVAIRTIDDAAKDKSRFVAWLDANGHTPERLAAQLASLKASKDRRVAYRAVELETRIRGFFAEQEIAGGFTLNIIVPPPRVREPRVISIDAIKPEERRP